MSSGEKLANQREILQPKKRFAYQIFILFVESGQLDGRNSLDELHRHVPGIAAHLAILDVTLNAAASGIETNLHSFTAVRTGYVRRCVRCSVAQREFVVEVIEIHSRKVVSVPCRNLNFTCRLIATSCGTDPPIDAAHSDWEVCAW